MADLKLTDVGKTYGGTVEVLKHIDLDITAGDDPQRAHQSMNRRWKSSTVTSDCRRKNTGQPASIIPVRRRSPAGSMIPRENVLSSSAIAR